MKFDRNTYNQGMDVDIALENGKALLTWRFKYAGRLETALLTLVLKDREGRTVLTCLRREPEEEPLQAVLLHPRLWKGVEDPYLYRMEVFLQNPSGQLMDSLAEPFPLRSLRRLPEGKYYLNDSLFQPRTVNYSLPKVESQVRWLHTILEDIRLLQELGANSIHCDAVVPSFGELVKLCDRAGILIWPEEGEYHLRGGDHSLLNPVTGIPNALFYNCKARWSAQRFVYILPESIQTAENGNYTVTAYSNCGRVALYADGALFEFQSGEYEFVFEKIPARHPCVMLTAEAEDCIMSLAVHKSFISRSLQK